MQTLKLNTPARRVPATTVRPLRAVAIYDDLVSLVYAQEALSSLKHTIPADLYLDWNIWSFARLMKLDVRHESIRVASEADIIIVASHSSAASIPAHIVTWLNSALQENSTGAPLLVALDEKNIEKRDPASVLLSELSDIAQYWDSPLICNTEFDECLENGLITGLAMHQDQSRSSSNPTLYKLLPIS